MELLQTIVDFIIHIDRYLIWIIEQYGVWVYLILFLIIFVETGLVAMPFLPGDSLLFTAGTLCAVGSMNVFLLMALLFLAAVLGDNTNYAIGNYLGLKVFRKDSRIFNEKHLIRTRGFFDKYGGKTLIIARFVPFIRTYAPFVAGASSMDRKRFLGYNLVGGALWIISLLAVGYFFGNLPIVKENYSVVLLLISVISLSPLIIKFISNLFLKIKKHSIYLF
ncbi:MAG: VTT domain-containing protein [Sediminicola sp.]|tara:strand:- start:41339 stop:42001 length:663 start_codon:yes stop_codon:yes gene_type:complete